MNCWEPLKTKRHNMTREGGCEGLRSFGMKQWEISSQVAWEQVEGSTTRSWSPNFKFRFLNLKVDGKDPRVQSTPMG